MLLNNESVSLVTETLNSVERVFVVVEDCQLRCFWRSFS